MPNEVRLALIDEIEEAKAKKLMTLKTIDDDFTIKSIWPQLKKALTWLMKNQFEGAAELLATIVSRRKKEIDLEEKKTQEQVKLMLEQVKHRQKADTKTILFEVCCGENSRLMFSSNKEEEMVFGYTFQSIMLLKIIPSKQQKERPTLYRMKDSL